MRSGYQITAGILVLNSWLCKAVLPHMKKFWVLESSSFNSDNFLCSFYPLILLSPTGITQAKSDPFSYNNITNLPHSSLSYFGLNIFNSPGEKKCSFKKLTLSKVSDINLKYRKWNSSVSFSLNRYSSDLVFSPKRKESELQ